PGTGAAAETDTVELAERLLLISGLLQLRCDELAYGALECDEQNRGDQRRAGNARHGDPGGTDHGQLTAAGKLPEADERADERGDRQQLIDLLRQVEQCVPERVRYRVMADSDVVLLADEDDQPPQHEQ